MIFSHSLFFFFMVALYLVAFYNCFRIMGERQPPSTTFAWILFHFLLPMFAIPIYFLLGKNRIRGYIRRRAASDEEFAEHTRQIAARFNSEHGAFDVPDDLKPYFNLFAPTFGKFGPVFEPHPGRGALLVDGKATFEAIFGAIASAHTYIFVQYYILRSDRLGLELKELLIKKAREGVKVFVLYDDMGSFWLSQDYIRDLIRAGIRVERFLPVRSLKRGFQINFRNHRKLVTVDGLTAFTGGLNIGEEYAERRFRSPSSRRLFWRDTHLQLAGAAVAQLEEVFLEDWHFASGETMNVPSPKAAPFQSHAPLKDVFRAETTPSPCLIQVVPSQPTDDRVIGVLLFMQIIQAAKQRLWIATPYFVPDTTLLRELELAVLRGVDLRVIVPRKSDNPVVHWVSLSYAEQLQKVGVKVHLYDRGFMHQKVALIDDSVAVLGTTNLDNRGLFLNFETTLLLYGKEFCSSVDAVLRNDLKACRELSPTTRRFRKIWFQTRENLARLLAPLL